jgi:mRNA interferase MazF
MVVERGEIWWADLDDPKGSEPGFPRPVLIVQRDSFNRSRINTVIALALTTNLNLVSSPGNVLIASKDSGLPRDSVANVSQVITVDKNFLTERVGRIQGQVLTEIEDGLRMILNL